MGGEGGLDNQADFYGLEKTSFRLSMFFFRTWKVTPLQSSFRKSRNLIGLFSANRNSR